ncbi:MAG TPA: GNAT family N-acetyltransferase [Symbiobacteriaceae bacterium]|nr:GNAT family N-acetyltransferase [Symbiobacteriaceae bacterium]
MEFILRPFHVPADYSTCVKFVNMISPEPYTAEDWLAEDAAGPTGMHIFRMVAVAPDGVVAGFAECMRFPTDKPGDYPILALVDPNYRRQGLGAQLLAVLEEHALAQGAITFSSTVRDAEPESVAWAEKWGYAQYRHTFQSTLDLATFDPAPFAAVIPAVETSGITFTTLAERSDDSFLRAVAALMTKTHLDIPGNESSEQSYEAWESWYIKHKDARMDGIIVALDGDRVAGVTALRQEGAEGNWYTNYTGVHRDYRGRQIALALKLKSIALAQAAGAKTMRTNNDSKNVPMLAVNRKLGYKPEPGYLRYRKTAK